ncbi:MAG TPA: hypothetical protein VK604_05105 [Bryobacteraceae bacterium]|nr:hypothetical protein [Bryobacteraceae bacterium]
MERQSESQPICGIFPKEVAVADISSHGIHTAVAGLMHDGVFGFAGGGDGSGEAGAHTYLGIGP